MKTQKINDKFAVALKTREQSFQQTFPSSVGQKASALISDAAGGSHWQIRNTTPVVAGVVDWTANDNGAFAVSLSANQAFTFQNALEGMVITLVVKNTSGATITLTFPTLKTQGTLINTVEAGKENIYTIFFMNGSYYALALDGVA